MSQPSVVITGVSTGIGRASAQLLAERGFRVFGSVRKAQDAQGLVAELGARFVPLVFDVTDTAAVAQAAQQVGAALGGRRLAGLVNNAGIAVAGPVTHLPIDEFRRQLEINLVAPLLVSQAFLPLLGTDPALQGPCGRIVMMGSVAGRLSPPFLGPYSASKHGLEGLSDAMRRELQFYRIGVSVIGPGHVATPIWDKAEEMDVTPYESLPIAGAMKAFRDFFVAEGRKGYPPRRIAEAVHHALTSAHPRTRYAVVPGRLLNWTLPRLLPARAVDRILALQLGLRPPR